MPTDKNTMITTILAVIIIIGSVVGMSARFVSEARFDDFKEGIISRLGRIEVKLDKLLEQ